MFLYFLGSHLILSEWLKLKKLLAVTRWYLPKHQHQLSERRGPANGQGSGKEIQTVAWRVCKSTAFNKQEPCYSQNVTAPRDQSFPSALYRNLDQHVHEVSICIQTWRTVKKKPSCWICQQNIDILAAMFMARDKKV